MSSLYEQITGAFAYNDRPSIPSYIKENLKHTLFPWQKEALQYLLFHTENNKKNPNTPTHLMFNLATGAGKTLLMAATMLYYYKKGYRRFLFFVNQTNIVNKTEHNFIDDTHPKYLFKDNIVIDNQTIPIRKVTTFSHHPTGIEIKFTTIQKLYEDIYQAKENETTLGDLRQQPLVMLADEAHHLNTHTSKKKQPTLFNPTSLRKVSAEEAERLGWEHMVIECILNSKPSDNTNVLLEFTATIPSKEAVVKKYTNKTIYTFGLKDFLRAGYTKEINLISSTLEKKERILQALLFQWYRHRIALQYRIPNVKPVMLLRSKTIEASRQDHQAFLDWIHRLTADDFNFLRTIADTIHASKQQTPFEMGKSRTEQVLAFIKQENISYQAIAHWIKQNYQERNVIITNSKQNKTKKEKTDENIDKLLNSLEDKDNHIRAIFTVDRLTEGWDVLNLFDIVRLYKGQNSGGSTKKAPDATIKERQLIGRGVRYYPFAYLKNQPYKRKFDHDLQHPLRVLEELYYYTYDEKSLYISHLKEELRKEGYIQDDKVVKTFALKESFQKSDFYKKTKIWYNKPIDNPARRKKELASIKQDFYMTYKVHDMEVSEQKVDLEHANDEHKLDLAPQRNRTIVHKVGAIEKHIFQKAIHIKAKEANSLYRFERLRNELDIQSMDDLQKDKLSDFDIHLIISANTTYETIAPVDKLKMTLAFLGNLERAWQEMIVPKIGSTFTLGPFNQFFATPKTKTVDKAHVRADTADMVENAAWYVLDGFAGTREEEDMMAFIKDNMRNLEEKYKEIYLLRNEEVYKIYDFAQGRGFQPDFLLFLKAKHQEGIEGAQPMPLYYQVFIEVKGRQYLGSDGTFDTGKEGWKEQFLQAIGEGERCEEVIQAENAHYRLIGLPFFNQAQVGTFREAFDKFLL